MQAPSAGPIPPPIITNSLMVDAPSCSSPLDQMLMERKVQRTTPRMPCSPTTFNSVNAINDNVIDSFRAQATSSPIGTALMERRIQRQSTRNGSASARSTATTCENTEAEEVQRRP